VLGLGGALFHSCMLCFVQLLKGSLKLCSEIPIGSSFSLQLLRYGIPDRVCV